MNSISLYVICCIAAVAAVIYVRSRAQDKYAAALKEYCRDAAADAEALARRMLECARKRYAEGIDRNRFENDLFRNTDIKSFCLVEEFVWHSVREILTRAHVENSNKNINELLKRLSADKSMVETLYRTYLQLIDAVLSLEPNGFMADARSCRADRSDFLSVLKALFY